MWAQAVTAERARQPEEPCQHLVMSGPQSSQLYVIGQGIVRESVGETATCLLCGKTVKLVDVWEVVEEDAK